MIRTEEFEIYDAVEQTPQLLEQVRACSGNEPEEFYKEHSENWGWWQRMCLKKELKKLSEKLPPEGSDAEKEPAAMFGGVFRCWDEVRRAKEESEAYFQEKTSSLPGEFRASLLRVLREPSPELTSRREDGTLGITLHLPWGGWRLCFVGCDGEKLDHAEKLDLIYTLFVRRENGAPSLMLVGYNSLRGEFEPVSVPFSDVNAEPFAFPVFCAPDAPLFAGQEEDYRSAVMRIVTPLSARFADLGEKGLNGGEQRALPLALVLSGREDSAELLGEIPSSIDIEELLSGFTDEKTVEHLRDELSAAIHGDEKTIHRAQSRLNKLLSPMRAGRHQRLLYRDAWQLLLWQLSERRSDGSAEASLVRLPEPAIPESLRPAAEAVQKELDASLDKAGFAGAFPFYRREKGRHADYLYAVMRLPDGTNEPSEPSAELTFRIGRAHLSMRREPGSAKKSPKRPYLAKLDVEETNTLDCLFERGFRCSNGRLGSLEKPLMRITADDPPEKAASRLEEHIETVERVFAGKPAPKSYRAEKYGGKLDARSVLTSVIVGLVAAVCFFLLSLIVLLPVFTVLSFFFPAVNWIAVALIVPAAVGVLSGLLVGCSHPAGVLARRAFPLL